MSRRQSLFDLEDIARQISGLRHEMRGASRYGAHAAHDVGDQLWHGGEVMARQLGRTARKAGKAVRDDPVPAVVAVAGFALFLNLVLSRKQR